MFKSHDNLVQLPFATENVLASERNQQASASLVLLQTNQKDPTLSSAVAAAVCDS